MKTTTPHLATVLICCFAATLSAQTQPTEAPHKINFQGKLNNPTSGTVNLTFSIYKTPAVGTGTALWSETQNNVAVLNGIFNVILGDAKPTPTLIPNIVFKNGGDLFLEIKVGSNTLPKRVQIASVAYAVKATHADTARVAMKLAGDSGVTGVFVDNNGNVGIGTTSPSHKLHVFDGTGVGNGVLIQAGFPFGAGTYPSILTLKDKDNVYELFKFKSDGSFYFNRGPDTVLTGSSKGNVRIGRSTDTTAYKTSTFKLQVVSDDALVGLFESKINGGILRLQTSEGHDNRVEMINRSGGLLALVAGERDRLVITRTGNVGIGGSPDNYAPAKLVVYGQIASMSPFIEISDFRYKKNLTLIPNALDKITRLRGVSFDWRREEFPELNFNKGRNLGFIAQEIKEVLPEVVSQDSKGYYSVAYSNIVPVLVEAIKEQQSTIAQLQAQVTELAQTKTELQQSRTELATFKEKLSRIESSLQRLEQLVAREENASVHSFSREGGGQH